MSALNVFALLAKPDLTLQAKEQRQADPEFIARCAIGTLAPKLPLPWPTPPVVGPSPKPRYRSDYQPPEQSRLPELDEAAWQQIGLFDVLLALIDFSGLRPVLAEKLYRRSARGRVPFDPISLLLLFFWQTINRWCRLEVLRRLALSRNADYARSFGFRADTRPSESGYRYFLTVLGRKYLNDLIKQSMDLIYEAGVLPLDVLKHAIVGFDGQIHDAASRLRCHDVQASCYQPTSPEEPRPCPAKAKGKEGCDCDTTRCRLACKRATPWDPDARYVFHRKSNQSRQDEQAEGPQAPAQPSPTSEQQPAEPSPSGANPPAGEEHYGYSSLPARLTDPLDRTAFTLGASPLAGANEREEERAAALLQWVVSTYDYLHVEFAVGDAGFGYEPFLAKAAELHVRRVVDLRADPRTDNDKGEWVVRGYDNVGWPVCEFGYRLHPNGFDSERHRSKWYCGHACENLAASGAPGSQPAPDCAYRDRSTHPFGRIIDVGATFADNSYRLVRDVPYDSPNWKLIYRRTRNASEERNSEMQALGLKRLSVFGAARAQAALFLAEVLGNLLTLARFVKEATLAALAKARQAG